jgi:hypothetical protein
MRAMGLGLWVVIVHPHGIVAPIGPGITVSALAVSLLVRG